MWLNKLMCVFLLATAAPNALTCLFWSSCTEACGGGEKTRWCLFWPESVSCNQICYNGYSYSDGCLCSAWRTGRCCEGCSNPGIDHCKPGMYECGGSPDGIRCTDCDLPYKPAGFNKGCERKSCNENNGDCSHWCTTFNGLTKCTCRDGYQLSPDEYSCIGSESTSRQLKTSPYSTADISSITPSTYYETSDVLTKASTPDASTTFRSSSSVITTQMYTTLATDSALSANIDGTGEYSKHPYVEGSTALAIGLSVSVGILLLGGGAGVIVLLRRRGIFHCNRKTENNKPSENETLSRENMKYGKSNEDNAAHHNYFIIGKCGQSISSNAEHCNESNDVNTEDNYNTIHETDKHYEHVEDESSDYDHTTNALTSGSDAKKPENEYNELKIDRLGDNVHEQRRGQSAVQSSEDDYDTTSAVMAFGKDDVSDYNHIPSTAYKAGTTCDDIKCDKGGDYDAINNMKFKVAQSDSSDYAHVNKD